MIHIKTININIFINHAKLILKEAEQNLAILETMWYAFSNATKISCTKGERNVLWYIIFKLLKFATLYKLQNTF